MKFTKVSMLPEDKLPHFFLFLIDWMLSVVTYSATIIELLLLLLLLLLHYTTLHSFSTLFSGQPGHASTRKAEPFW